MEVIRFIIFFHALLAFFVAGGLFFRESNLKSVTIGILMALFGAHMLLFLYGSGSLVRIFPEYSSWFYYEIGLLFGPVLFLHLQAIIFHKNRIGWKDLLHLLPILIFWLGYGDVLLMPGELRRAYVREHFLSRTMTWNYLLAIQLLIYALLCLFIIIRFKHQILRRQIAYALGMVGIYIAATLVIVWLTWFAEGWRDFSIYYLVLSLLIFGVGYILYADTYYFSIIRKKYFTSSLDARRIAQISEKIRTAFHEEAIFLRNDLSIKSLAEHIDENPYYITQTFSESFKESFNDFVNRHRVYYSQSLLRSPDHHHLKIEAIAREAGFNNKVTFYKAFTKFLDITPSVYRKSSGTDDL